MNGFNSFLEKIFSHPFIYTTVVMKKKYVSFSLVYCKINISTDMFLQTFFDIKVQTCVRRFSTDRSLCFNGFLLPLLGKVHEKLFFSVFFSFFRNSLKMLLKLIRFNVLLLEIFGLIVLCFKHFFQQNFLSIFMLHVLRSVPLDSRKTFLFNFALCSTRIQIPPSVFFFVCESISNFRSGSTHEWWKIPEKKLKTIAMVSAKSGKVPGARKTGKNQCSAPENNTF